MKKSAALLTVIAMLLAAFSLVASAEAKAIGDVHVPYAVKAPTLDGTLSENEWDTAKKTTFSKDTATVAYKYASGYDIANFDFYFDMYYAWDENYLYIAWDMHGSAPWYDYGGNYIRGYFDPKGILKDYCTEKGNVKAKGMPRVVAAVKKDASGIFGAQQLGISNIDFTEGNEYGLKLTDYGWTYECKVEWNLLRDNLRAITGNSGLTLNPEAGMTVRANYDCQHINEANTFNAFLTTSIDQANINDNVWNFSEYADINLILDADPTSYEYYLVTAPTVAAAGLYNKRAYIMNQGEKVVVSEKVFSEDASISFESWYLRTMVQSKAGENGKLDVRFVSMLDENIENYKEAGFTVDDGTTTVTVKTTEANTSFIADGKEVSIGDYSEENDYFFLAKNMFSSEVVAADPSITVTPYVALADSRIISGSPITFKLSDLTK